MDAELELFEVLDDLEAEAAAVLHRERVAEVADRSRTEYQEVTLEARLMASVGSQVAVDVVGVGGLSGTLSRVGEGWLHLDGTRVAWSVRTATVSRVRGASSRAVPRVAWSPVARLGFTSVLRRVADEGVPVRLHLVDGSVVEGTVARVGADFVEVGGARTACELVALARVAALSR